MTSAGRKAMTLLTSILEWAKPTGSSRPSNAHSQVFTQVFTAPTITEYLKADVFLRRISYISFSCFHGATHVHSLVLPHFPGQATSSIHQHDDAKPLTPDHIAYYQSTHHSSTTGSSGTLCNGVH